MKNRLFSTIFLAFAALAHPSGAEVSRGGSHAVPLLLAAPGLSLIVAEQDASLRGWNVLRVQATCPRCVRWDAQGNCVEWRACRAPTGVRG
jgi:hypothetical protein